MKKYAVKEIEIKGEPEVVIVEYDDKDREVWVPSRLSDFIYREYMSKSLNTKLKVARAVVGFMNYIISQINLGEDLEFKRLEAEGLFGLQFNHLAKYIHYISNSPKVKNNYDTVMEKEKILVKFFNFINKGKITKATEKSKKKVVQVTNTSSVGAYKTKKGVVVNVSPFLDKQKYSIKYPPNKHKSKIKTDLDYEIWTQMIEYAELHYPQIAFGFAMQCMGGLRQGEVVNLNRDDVEVKREDNILMLNIQERPELLADRKIKKKKSQLKKDAPAEQPVFNFNNRLFELYENHLKYIDKCANDDAIRLKGLFIDSNGNCMSGDTYESTFRKLKRDFIEEVAKHSESEADKLRPPKYSWGSHIGRHVFTNYLIKIGAVNDIDGMPDYTRLRLLRRDKREESAITYIDKKTVVEGVTQAVNKLSEAAQYSNK